jgi:glycosyltransferase involved in cell wall biosynthesis
MAGQHGVGANVTFAGWREDVDALLSASDLFVLSSRTEGFPNALVEAMAQEIPVLATRVGAVGEILEDGALGVICEADRDSVAVALIAALADRKRLRRRAEDARRRLETRYDPRHVIAQYRDLYLGVAGSSRLARPLR